MFSLFDLNGDGKLSVDETFLEFMIMTECLKEDDDSLEPDTDLDIGDGFDKHSNWGN